MYGTTRMHNGDVENPEKGLQNSIERDGGDGKSMQIVVRRNVEAQGKSEDEKGRKDKMKIRKFEEIWTSVEMERVAERKGATGQGRWLGYSSWRQTER